MSAAALPGVDPAPEPPRPARRLGWPMPIAQAWSAGRDHALGLSAVGMAQHAWQIRAGLRPAHLDRVDAARVLGFVAAAAQATLGVRAHDEQGLAAWWMLQGRMVEMATGEGKTLATGLAAATAALAGMSVHVMTANDYLVRRDREQLQPLFERLGLGSADVVAGSSPDERRRAYRQPIVYVTARELVFDHLKDHLSSRAERDPRVLRARALVDGPAAHGPSDEGPLLPGLQQGFIDEADSILLDEAVIPFVLSLPGAAPPAGPLQAARALAATLVDDEVRLDAAQRRAAPTAVAWARLQAELLPDGPLWPPRVAAELLRAALTADRLLHRDRDYAVVDGRVLLVDEITGRIAQGRQWAHPLQAMVELKEGCEPSAPLHTAARITYQRFFPRYVRLGGMSGTLREARGELRALYRCPVSEVPRVRPSQLRWLGGRWFVDAAARRRACVARIRAVREGGQPVLVGTGSVEESRALATALADAGVPCQVLNAVQDAEEARQVAQAGVAGCVTVTTNMAGRGTDIRLDAAARAAGGLHVILAQGNRSRRIDRQLSGRAARQGDPGSAEALWCLDDAPLASGWLRRWRPWLATSADAHGELPAAWAAPAMRLAQRVCERRARALRRELQRLDEALAERMGYAGPLE